MTDHNTKTKLFTNVHDTKVLINSALYLIAFLHACKHYKTMAG